MTFTDIAVIAVVAVIVLAVVLYLRREKRKGAQCVGCPYAKQCAARAAGQGCSVAPQQAGQSR